MAEEGGVMHAWELQAWEVHTCLLTTVCCFNLGQSREKGQWNVGPEHVRAVVSGLPVLGEACGSMALDDETLRMSGVVFLDA